MTALDSVSLALLALSTLVFLAGVALVALIHSRYHLDIVVRPEGQAAPGPAEPLPLISVIVPARNEARNIRRCAGALLAQDYPHFELIVVDDRSSDGTGALLAALQAGAGGRLRVVQGAELPPGWAGKPHALHQGVGQARGEWLCFVDADTFAAPALLSAARRAAREQGADMLSLLTGQELESFWERAVLPLVFTALSFGFPARRVNDPARPEAIANGQFILIRREAYEAVGGHQAVRDRIAEDLALAQRVKGGGFRLIVADGRELARTRMYTSLAEIWEGWTKNIFIGMQGRLGLLLFGVLVGLFGALGLPAWLVGAALWLPAALRAGSGAAWVPALVLLQALGLWAYLLWQRARAAQAFGLSPLYAFTFPAGALLFTAMMLASAGMVLSGRGVTWKGRRYGFR